MHHTLDPSAPHSLAFCASVDTRETYWKDEAKDPDEARKYTSDMAAFYTYNGKDCCVTKELIDGYYTRLLAERRTTSMGDTTALDFYLHHYAEVFRPLLELMAAGVRVDSTQRARRYGELVGRVSELKTQILAQQVHHNVEVGTSKSSPRRIRRLLFRVETLDLNPSVS